MDVSTAAASSIGDASNNGRTAPVSAVQVGDVGYTDVSTLKIVGVITPANSTVAPPALSTPQPGAPVPQAVAATVNTNCGTRIDWYRVVATNGVTYCYSNAGDLGVYLPNIKYLCPGNNNGYVSYRIPGNPTHYNSTYRTPPADFNTCYAFTDPVTVEGIHLR